MAKPTQAQRPRVPGRSTVGGNAPGKFKLRLDLGRERPDAEVTVRCAYCDWYVNTTASRMSELAAQHRRHRHGGKP